ncbi:uncharacterized protein LOC127656002 [Xyrauchen texanus]|uniref:uncharacterized protein LOC127656002 n=1 Tax=Xyrauchen texanus TaxID=154827 RepID=UPI002241A74C|nr:uncharacterized protein LOC127656002 [Xyrauchen texanus]XP_052000079.1 uncharacterized protein LOC127656002 [Xyrauchen texanus]
MTQGWNALQQAQIPSNQSSIGTVMESEESFSHDIEQLIEKENLSGIMDLQEIDRYDLNELNTESCSLQDVCYESSLHGPINSATINQDMLRDKVECNGYMAACNSPKSGEFESAFEAHSDREVSKPALTNANLVDYSDISSCSETEANLDCNFSSEVNLGGNQSGQSLEEGDQNSENTMHFSDECHSTGEVNGNETNQQQDTGGSGPPMTTCESKEENVNHVSEGWREESRFTNVEDQCAEVQTMDDFNGLVPLSKEKKIGERDILAHDSGYPVNETMVHCKELGTSLDGSTCVLYKVNHETPFTLKGDENNCLTIDSLSGCKMDGKKPDPENTSSSNEDQGVERSSFGFLETCFGLKSSEQNIEDLKHLEYVQVNHVDDTDFSVVENVTQIPERDLFNHIEPPILLKIAVESKNGIQNGEEINAPKDPPVLSACQTPTTSLSHVLQNVLSENAISESRFPLSSFKTQTRKLQPVVLLKTTEKSTSDGKKYHCFKCRESTQSSDELIEHYHCTHSLHESQYCPTCKSYLTGGTLSGQHICGNVMLNYQLKSLTYTKGVIEEKGKFVCRYCTKSFVRQTFHQEHELRHIFVTQHRCKRCGLYFSSAQKCQSHKRKAQCQPLILESSVQTVDHAESTLKNSDINFELETDCSNTGLSDCYVTLVDVCNRNQSPEQICCQICGKSFRLRAQLKSHQRSHSDEKLFKCEYCGKAFKYSWNLNKHKREKCCKNIVPLEKPSVPESRLQENFKCPICTRVFKYSYNRTRHLREQCLKEYTQKGKGKIGENKYRCPLCKDVFTLAGNRKRHIWNTCVKLKMYTAKRYVKRRKEIKETIKTNNEGKELPLTLLVQNQPHYKCTFCPSVYASKSGFYGHLAKHKLLAKNKKATKYKHVNTVVLKSSCFAGQRPTDKESTDEDVILPFSCRFCGRAFTSSHSFKKHLQHHKGNKPFRCLDCGQNFARHGNLMTHKNVHKRKLQCSDCGKVLPSIGDLLKHRLSHPNKGLLKCPDCPMQFRFPVFLLRHVVVHERKRSIEQATSQKVIPKEEIPKEEFKCALCQKAFHDSKALSEHCLTHMPGPSASKCQFCKRDFSSRAVLIRHIRLHTGEKPFPCVQCGMHFHRQEALKLHQEKCTVVQKPCKCSYCPQSFRFPNNLELHERAHLAKTLFPCPKCGKFYSKKKIKAHESVCNCEELRPACRNCGKPFSSKKYRSDHEVQCQGKISNETVTNGKNRFKQRCPHCFKGFRSKGFLLRHLSIHSEEKTYACMHCGQKYDSQQRYLQHEAFCNGVSKERGLENLSGTEKIKSTFTAEKKRKDVKRVSGENVGEFKCKFCTKSFSRPRYLRRHILTHTEVKPYRCKTCESCFSRYDHLKLHQTRCRGKSRLEVRVVKMSLDSLTTSCQSKEQQENEALQCKICSKQLSTLSDLKSHMTMLHITDKPFPCKRCGKSYSSIKTLRKHNLTIKCKRVLKESEQSAKNNVPNQPCRETSKLLQRIQVHYINKFKYQCEYCPRRFKLPGQLKVHLRLHTGEKPYGCANCGEHFIRTDYLKRHLIKCIGKGKSQEKVLCDNCGGLFTRDALLVHQNTCVVSSKSSEVVRNAKSPIKIKGFSCTFCSDRFLLFSQLQQHFLSKHRSDQPQESNEGQQQLESSNPQVIKQEPVDEEYEQNQPSSSQKPAKEQCKKSYKDLNKPLECPQCHMRFVNTSGLGRHMRIHSGVYPLSCKKCHIGFWSKKSMENHRKKCRGHTIITNNNSTLENAGELEGYQNDTVLVFNKGSNTTGTGVLQTKFSCKDQDTENSADKGDAAVHKFSCKDQDTENGDNKGDAAVHKFSCKDQDTENGDNKGDAAVHKFSCKDQDTENGADKGDAAVYKFSCKDQDSENGDNKGDAAVHKFSCKDQDSENGDDKGDAAVHKFSCKDQDSENGADKGDAAVHKFSCKDQDSEDGADKGDSAVHKFSCKDQDTENGADKGDSAVHKFSCKDQDTENGADKGDAAVHKYQCSECDQSFTDGLRLISHLEEHGRENQHKSGDVHRCHVCSKVFGQAGLLQKHVNIQHKKKTVNTCPICFKSFRFPSDVDIHKSCHDPNRPFVCNKCEFRYWTAKSLSIHQRMAHPLGELPKSKEPSAKAGTELPDVYRCHPCDKTYTLKSSYAKHCRLKHGPNSVKNLVDNESKKSSVIQESDKEESNGDFEDGDDSDNDSDSAPYFPCHVCGKTFLTSESLEDHQRCHLGEKPFECEECGKCFFQLANLQQHQRSHKSEFQCQMCGKGFVSLFALRKHKLKHVRNRPHHCTKCHLSFTSSSDLAEHMVTHRDENFPCDLCDKTFSCKSSRAEHRKIHTEQEEELPPLIPPEQPQTKKITSAVSRRSLPSSNVEQYKYCCGICQVRFSDPEQLSEHGCNPAKERPYSCPECSKHFLHGSHLKKHQLSHQLSGPRSYQCNHCNMSFNLHHLYLTHLRSHGNEEASTGSIVSTSDKRIHTENAKHEKIYQCPICPESFEQAMELANHLSVHSHKCSVCNMTFPSKKNLEEHEKCHLSAATQYECTECGDSFLGSDAFRKHNCRNRKMPLSQMHPSVSSAAYPLFKFEVNNDEEEEVDVGEDFINCPICQKRFSSNSSLADHHKKHHEDPRPFKCLVCKKGFTKKKYLTQHQQIHSERPYKCNVCSESFKTESALISHNKTHDIKRKHQCSICKRSYLTAHDLLKHERKHTVESFRKDNGDFRCDMCYKSFTMPSQLRQHQETHVGQIVYECTECDKAFAFLSLLEEHQQQSHPVSAESLESQSPTYFPYQSPVTE